MNFVTEKQPATSQVEVTKNLLAHDVAFNMQGKLPQKKIEANTKAILSEDTTAYPATGSISSLVLYMGLQVNVDGGEQFNGDAWGVSFPGGGALKGDVYTDDIDRLYSDTKSFAFTGTPVYLAIYFYDGDGNYLGSFQAGAVSTVIGTGGGSGSWS